MAITTFLSEKVRDPRTKGVAPSPQEITENFSIQIIIENISGDAIYKLRANPVLDAENQLTIIFPALDPNFSLELPIGEVYENTDIVGGINLTIAYDGDRTINLDWTVDDDSINDIDGVIYVTYIAESFHFIETMYMQYDSENSSARTMTPTIYVHGKLSDIDSVNTNNIVSGAITAAKLGTGSVTTNKIGNEQVTSEKIKFNFTELKTDQDVSYTPQRWKITFVQGV